MCHYYKLTEHGINELAKTSQKRFGVSEQKSTQNRRMPIFKVILQISHFGYDSGISLKRNAHVIRALYDGLLLRITKDDIYTTDDIYTSDPTIFCAEDLCRKVENCGI